jgi:hypothetical protein
VETASFAKYGTRIFGLSPEAPLKHLRLQSHVPRNNSALSAKKRDTFGPVPLTLRSILTVEASQWPSPWEMHHKGKFTW